jgi:hypothetical protein
VRLENQDRNDGISEIRDRELYVKNCVLKANPRLAALFVKKHREYKKKDFYLLFFFEKFLREIAQCNFF